MSESEILRISLQIHIFRNIIASVIMKLVEEDTSTLCIEIFRKIHDPLTRDFWVSRYSFTNNSFEHASFKYLKDLYHFQNYIYTAN